MSVIFSAITSHLPLLIPEVGKENTNLLKKSLQAYHQLEEELFKLSPDTIVIFSPHGLVQPEALTINVSSEFIGKFEEFGDLANKFKLAGDIQLASKIKESLETKAQLQIISEPILDSGSAVPLFLLTKKLPKVKIIPIYNSQQDLESHYQFGRLLKHELGLSEKKIAIIASADLSHKLNKEAPGGYSTKAKGFDKKVLKAIREDKIEQLIKLDPELIAEVNETGLRPIIMLLGVLDNTKKTAKLLSYESPFGVGSLVVDYLF